MKSIEKSYLGVLEDLLNSESDYIIYPFGVGGKVVKKILNLDYGIEEKYVVDNKLASQGKNYKRLAEIDKPDDYIWIISSIDETIHNEIISTLDGVVSWENRIDMYELCKKQNLIIFNKKYKLLSHIGDNINSKACTEVIELVKEMKNERRNINVAEVGCGVGATSVEVCSLLEERDSYYCFDYEEVVRDLVHDLKGLSGVKCNIKAYGNTHKVFDSYNWNLSELIYDMRQDDKDGLFDLAYLDAAHNFEYDGLACCLLKQLIRKGGYIVFDDMNWSYGYSSTGNPIERPSTEEKYENKQIYDCQIRRVVNMFMLNDSDWVNVYPNYMSRQRAVFKRIR